MPLWRPIYLRFVHGIFSLSVLKLNVISKAKGSAYIEMGKTKVIVSVFDPREIPNKQNNFRWFSVQPFARCTPGINYLSLQPLAVQTANCFAISNLPRTHRNDAPSRMTLSRSRWLCRWNAPYYRPCVALHSPISKSIFSCTWSKTMVRCWPQQ